jgi:hypothetical protein
MPAHTLLPRSLIGVALIGAGLFASLDAVAGDCRTIEQQFDAAAIEALEIDVDVGELDVTPSEDGQVHVSVEVCARNHWFSLRRHKAEKAALEADQDDGSLQLAINGDDYEEDWTVRMPATVALQADLGVGAASISGLRQNINLDVGVGDAQITGKAADYGRVSGDAGVGDIRVEASGGSSRSERAVVSDSVTWIADGSGAISADVGVGDVEIVLD